MLEVPVHSTSFRTQQVSFIGYNHTAVIAIKYPVLFGRPQIVLLV